MLQSIQPGLHAYYGTSGNKVAAFDLDWTLIRSIRARFPKDENDWALLPNRIETLKYYRDNGYALAIFTNQGYKGAKINMAVTRINNVLAALIHEGLNPWVFAATGQGSIYRKPSPNMWTVLAHHLPNINMKESFYVGDAAGRPQDYDSNDRDFAHAVGLSFYVPEEIFPTNQVTIPDTQTMFIFVGMPGSGKTTYYQQHLPGWFHANQDTLKTHPAMLKAIANALVSGQSVAVDATNPSADKRRDYLALATKYNIPTMILYFVRNGYEWNKLRSEPVPTVAYNMYYKNLVEPSFNLDGVPVVEIS